MKIRKAGKWKNHPTHINYLVSISGKVIKRNGESPPIKYNGRYMHVYISMHGWVRLHWFVLETYVSPKPDGKIGRHLDDNPKNNSISNLKWGTHSENALDRVNNGNQNPPPQNTYWSYKRRNDARKRAINRKRNKLGQLV